MRVFDRMDPKGSKGRGTLPATEAQIRMLFAIIKKIDWTWEELALYAQLYVDYPFCQIGEELPQTLTKREAWYICNSLRKVQEDSMRAHELFNKLRQENPDVEQKWNRYWESKSEGAIHSAKSEEISTPSTHHNLGTTLKRYCPECSQVYTQAEAKYCLNDGHKLIEKDSCVNCGASLPKPSAKFCMECGAEQAS